MASQNTHATFEGTDTNDNSRFVENITPRASPFPHSKRPQGVREVIRMYSLYRHQEPSSSLSRLVYDGDVQRVKGCLDNITDREIDAVDRNGFSALHYAAQLNRVEILNMLINSGATIDNVAENAMTPLHVACRYANEQIVYTLLKKGSDSSLKTNEGFTALHYAARTGNLTIVRALLQNKSTMVNARDVRGATPLHDACARGHYELCELLLKNDAAIGARTVEGETPLHISSCNGDYQVVELLIEKAESQGMDLRDLLQGDQDQRPVLHGAVRGGNLQVLELLLRKGAQLHESKPGMLTVLHKAAFIGHKDILEALIARGAKVNARDSSNKTPLHSAALMDRVDAMELLLMKSANIEDKDNEGFTPLLSAVSVGHLASAKFLLDSGANITVQDNLLRSCLHIAVEDENEEMLTLLLQHAGDELLNLTDKRERTPLHYAALSKECKILETLLDKGSRCLVKDENLKTPLHLAAEFSKLKNIETLLTVSTSSVFEKDEMGRTPLHYAAMNGRSKICGFLLHFAEETDSKDICHWTALHWAANCGSVETVETLIEGGASANSRDKDGNTALHLAASNGHVNVITCLLDRGASIVVNNEGLNCLDYAIENELHLVIKTIVQHERWREVFEAKGKNKQSLLSKLIEKAPGAAETVLDKCIQRSPHSRRSYHYTITYDFRLLDPGPVSNADKAGKRFYGLSELLENQRENLIQHELVRTLLQTKWRKFGFPFYAMSLLMYLAFVALLTAFMLTERKDVKLPGKSSTSVLSEDDFKPKSTFNQAICYAGLAFLIFHMLREFYQIYLQKWMYFLSIQNMLDWAIYVTGFIYFLAFGTNIKGLREGNFAWECGTVCIFLSYTNLIFLTRAIQNLGLYVTMFMEVLKTLLRVIGMFMMFILAYALVFYILFKEQDAFSDFGKSFVKTTVMTIGEMNYEEMLITNLEQTVNRSGQITPLVPYPKISNAFFYIFLLTMPIVLMNLLIGLAVGDIETIRNTSNLRRIAAQINYLYEIESKWPLFVTRRLYKPQLVQQPNATPIVRWKRILLGWNNIEEQEEDEETTTTAKEMTQRYVQLDKRIGKTKKKVKLLAAMMEKQNQILEQLSSSRSDVYEPKTRL